MGLLLNNLKMRLFGEDMKDKQKDSTDVRFRLTNELHEPLKDMAKKEQRSMNYLMNKAVELLIKQESAKA